MSVENYIIGTLTYYGSDYLNWYLSQFVQFSCICCDLINHLVFQTLVPFERQILDICNL